MNIYKEKKYDSIGLFLLGLFSLCYTMYGANFAELNVNIKLLNFPIFIGEIFFAICLILVYLKSKATMTKINKLSFYLLIFLAIFIFYKVIKGYSSWGPLALRNAALFYYSFFAFIGYYFFNKRILNNEYVKIILILILSIILFFVLVTTAFTVYAYCILSLVLFLSYRSKVIRFFGSAWVLFLFLNINAYVHTKALFIATVIAILYLAFVLILLAYRRKEILTHRIRFYFLISCLIMVFFIAALFSNRNTIQRIQQVMNFSNLLRDFSTKNSYISEKSKNYQPRSFKVSLYEVNPKRKKSEQKKKTEYQDIGSLKAGLVDDLVIDAKLRKLELEKQQIKLALANIKTKQAIIKESPPKQSLAEEADIKEPIVIAKIPKESPPKQSLVKEADIKEPIVIAKIPKESPAEQPLTEEAEIKNKQELESISQDEIVLTKITSMETRLERIEQEISNILKSKKQDDKPVFSQETKEHIDKNNMMWRILVWRDMFKELFDDRALFGIDFGKPLRSKSLEILGWHYNYGRVGWIEPHNSFVHIFYRAGIVGLAFIIIIVSLFIKLAVYFAKRNNFMGILLSSILLHWLFLANFNVFLELPYYAIPCWILFGMVLALAYKRPI